jgi:hypothetical protein
MSAACSRVSLVKPGCTNRPAVLCGRLHTVAVHVLCALCRAMLCCAVLWPFVCVLERCCRCSSEQKGFFYLSTAYPVILGGCCERLCVVCGGLGCGGMTAAEMKAWHTQALLAVAPLPPTTPTTHHPPTACHAHVLRPAGVLHTVQYSTCTQGVCEYACTFHAYVVGLMCVHACMHACTHISPTACMHACMHIPCTRLVCMHALFHAYGAGFCT